PRRGWKRSAPARCGRRRSPPAAAAALAVRTRAGSGPAPRPSRGSCGAPDPRSGGGRRRPSLLGGRGLGRQQPLRLQLLPQRRGDVDLEHLQALVELGSRAAADDDAVDGGMAEWKLHRRRVERDVVPVADVADLLRALQELSRSGLIVVMSAGLGIGQDPAVVDAAGDDRDPALDAFGQQLLQRDLVEEGVAAREQETVEVALAREAGEHLSLVHAGTHGADDAFAAQAIQGAVGASERLAIVVVGVVNVQDVDAVEAKSLEALFERTHDSVVAGIEHRVDRGNATILLARFWRPSAAY